MSPLLVTALAAACFVLYVLAGPVSPSTYYTLTADFTSSPDAFFSAFDFFTSPDPTNGFVTYVDAATAASSSLIGYTNNSSIYIGTDFNSTLSPNGPGRDSIRISSAAVFQPGTAIIADIAHLPTGCGTWPALWMLGPMWPTDGEIDIIEGVNTASTNTMTLHTGPGCSVSRQSSANRFTGMLATDNCDASALGQDQDAGCSTITASNSSSFGAAFNNKGGGIFVAEWATTHIKIWFFTRASVPAFLAASSTRDVAASIDTTALGIPTASFAGSGCDFTKSFKNLQLVIDTTFCGAWAGMVWESGGCAAQTGYSSCNAFVAEEPGKFADAFWEIRGLRFYVSAGRYD